MQDSSKCGLDMSNRPSTARRPNSIQTAPRGSRTLACSSESPPRRSPGHRAEKGAISNWHGGDISIQRLHPLAADRGLWKGILNLGRTCGLPCRPDAKHGTRARHALSRHKAKKGRWLAPPPSLGRKRPRKAAAPQRRVAAACAGKVRNAKAQAKCCVAQSGKALGRLRFPSCCPQSAGVASSTHLLFCRRRPPRRHGTARGSPGWVRVTSGSSAGSPDMRGAAPGQQRARTSGSTRRGLGGASQTCSAVTGHRTT
jgi:hypothetical protein